MFTNVQDIHDSALYYVPEESLTPPSTKYKRVSIPYNPNRHCLGYLEGIGANYRERTRNDRKYVLKLWQNVEQSPDFLEGMENATIVGELDHPEERVDYSLTKGAVILTDFEIREDEGIVWTRFAILDNAEGRTLLSYVKFGSILGVSSRGLGDEVVQNGETIIDPETYEFFCFDVVAFPAVKSARQQYVDSGIVNETQKDTTEPTTIHKHLESMLKDKINTLENEEELKNLKVVIESTNIKNKNVLVDSITHKLSSLSESTDNQSNISEEIEKECDDSTKKIEELESQISCLKEALKKRGTHSTYFRKKLQEKRANENELEGVVSDNLELISTLNREINEAKEQQIALKKELTEAKKLLESVSSENKHWRHRFENKMKSNKDLKADNRKLSQKVESLTADSEKFQRKVESLESSLSHYRESLRCQKEEQASRLIESKKAHTAEQTLKDHKVSRLNEELSTAADKNKVLSDKNRSLLEENKLLEENVNKLKVQLEKRETKLKESRNSEAKMLDEYIRSQCQINNLKYEAVVNSLGKEKTIEGINKVIKEMSERQMKFDMLPMSIPTMTGRIVEHKSKESKSSLDEPSSFLVEALSKNK